MKFERFNDLSLSLFLCVSLGLSACGKQNKADVSEDAEQYRYAPANGELSKTFDKLQKSKWIDRCDLKTSKKAAMLVTIIDKRADEISKYAENLPASKNYKNIPFGNSNLSQYINPKVPPEGWQSYKKSWDQVYDDYEYIKNEPMNHNWIILNAEVRSMMTDDRKRILSNTNMNLNRDSKPKITALLKRVNECIMKENCEMPEFSQEEIEVIRTDYMYVTFMQEFTKGLSLSDARKNLENFAKRLMYDLTYYQLVPNPSITLTREGNDLLVKVPLDGSVFSDEQRAQLEGYIEPTWKSEGISLAIDWRKQWDKDIFKMFFDLNEVGARAYVAPTIREMHLYPLTTITALPHELGHVLGFPDHYYTQWKNDNCEYEIQYNDYDLMSGDSNVGKVTAEEWADLKNAYLKP